MAGSLKRIAFCIVLLGAFSRPGSISVGAWPQQEAPKQEDLIQKLLKLTNDEREKHGQKPLVLEPKLSKAAEWMAQDMADNNYFGHEDHRGKMVDTRVEEAGYSNWTRVGENIAGGFQNPEDAVQGWMNSPRHKTTLLRAEYLEVGFGYSRKEGTRYTYYWVQVFGSK